VPYNTLPNENKDRFGSCELFEERFPSCSGNPAKRLIKLNEIVQGHGWKGVGLWIAAQAKGENDKTIYDIDTLKAYWKERAIWCADAGICYWKVDWGIHAHDFVFRKMLTDIAKEYCPDLKIEHAYCMGPFNGLNDESRRFKDWKTESGISYLDMNIATLNFSDYLRIYDVAAELSVATTLDRVVELLSKGKTSPDVLNILNVEDELFLGAALGCSVGVMRHPIWNEEIRPDIGKRRKRIDEISRAIRWHRIAPPYGIGQNDVYVSDEIAKDSWDFGRTYDWSGVFNTTESQTSPIAVSRGIDLPLIIAGDLKPIVVASRHPVTKAVSIATLPRTVLDRGFVIPAADITLIVEECEVQIGIFGTYKSLNLDFSCDISTKKIFAQDLIGDECLDITSEVKIEGNRLKLQGELISKVGLSNATEFDASYPGLILVLK